MPLPAQLCRTISREEVNALPIRRYEGKVHLVTGPHEAAQARADFAEESVVGFDTETRPAFKPGERYPPALAQAATARAVYLFPLAHEEHRDVLVELLSSARIVKAGVGLAEDLRALKTVFAFHERSTVDLGAIARRHGLEQSGVRNLAALFLGLRIPKGAKTSNWAAPRLSRQQLTYAATDAWVCRELTLAFQRLQLFAP